MHKLNSALKHRTLEPQSMFFDSLLEKPSANASSIMNPLNSADPLDPNKSSELLNSIPLGSGLSSSSSNEHVADLPTFARRSVPADPLYSSCQEHINNLQCTIQRMSFVSLK